MPGFDQTGPGGRGPRTGRGWGYCVQPVRPAAAEGLPEGSAASGEPSDQPGDLCRPRGGHPRCLCGRRLGPPW